MKWKEYIKKIEKAGINKHIANAVREECLRYFFGRKVTMSILKSNSKSEIDNFILKRPDIVIDEIMNMEAILSPFLLYYFIKFNIIELFRRKRKWKK